VKNWLWNHNGDSDFKAGGICGIGLASADGNYDGKIPNTTANSAAGVVGKKYVKAWGPQVDHAMTIVGYDDRIEFDIDGDGKNDGPKSIGYVASFSQANPKFSTDAPLVYYRGASKKFPKAFVASYLPRFFDTDENIQKYFPDLDYPTRSGKALKKPTTVAQLWADEGKDHYSHYQQVGYNAIGFDIAKNLYNYVNRNLTLESLEIFDITDGGKPSALAESLTMKVGEKHQLVAVSVPTSVNNLDITVEGNLELSGIFYVTATAKGTGKIVIKQGSKVVKTINVTIN
jgi:hypothetical protein